MRRLHTKAARPEGAQAFSDTVLHRRIRRPRFSALALGDFGHVSSTAQRVARAMAQHDAASPLDAVLGLGDNFYPHGVASVHDRAFDAVWKRQFLVHERLRRPWMMLLGNHDLQSNAAAQIEYMYHENNEDGLWTMPARNYSFSYEVGADDGECFHAQFFVLDTNGVQGHVRRRFSKAAEDMYEYTHWLEEQLKASDARWKIVLGHHPCYTKGRWHGVLGECLRKKRYVYDGNVEAPGYDLERILVEGGAHLYLSGHEHMMQSTQHRGVLYAVAGATDQIRFYGGENTRDTTVQWVDPSRSTAGFAHLLLTADQLTLNFVNADDGTILHSETVSQITDVGLEQEDEEREDQEQEQEQEQEEQAQCTATT